MSRKSIQIIPLTEDVELRLFEFMNRDRISHFYDIYDLTYLREKTRTWVALSNNKLMGYMSEYDKRILTMRGNKKCTTSLLKNTDLTTAIFNIEPKHLTAVKRLFEPTEPPDKMTTGKITTFVTMKTNPDTFNPIIRHKVQELKRGNAQALGELLGAEPQRVQDLLRGPAFGIFKGNRLVSAATSPETLEDSAIIRGVQTAPEERNKGYSTSVCSALVQHLTKHHKDVMLYVSKDNPPALKVYKKIGFKETGHKFLSFIAQRKQKLPH